MKNLKSLFKLLTWILIPYTSCSSGNTSLSLIKVPNLTYSDTINDRGKQIISYGDSYIVKGLKNKKSFEKQIDNSIFKIYKLRIEQFDRYYVVIYKYSEASNLISMKKHGDRYSQKDIVYLYDWSDKGKYFHKYKFKDGEILNQGNKIKIEEIGDTSH